jgi:hypothetical protein
MSSISNKKKINFGFKRTQQLKFKPNEFLDDQDEQYTDFSQRNKKRGRE